MDNDCSLNYEVPQRKTQMTMTIRKLGRSLFAVFVMSITLLSLALLTPQIAHAASMTYYINNNSSICADSGSGSGISQSTPWCDFTPVNSRTFNPGDQILLARGDTWN